MSRVKILVYTSAAAALYQVLNLIIGLILPRFYLVTYGSEVNGLLTSVQQFISYLKYIEGGLGAALIYSLFKPLAEKNKTIVSGVISQAKRDYKKISGIYLMLVVILSIIYPFIIKSNEISTNTIMILVFVVGSVGAFDFYTMAKDRVLLTADQRVYVISLVSMVSLLIKFVMIYVLISLKVNIIIVSLATLMSIFVRSLIFRLYIKKHYPYIEYKKTSHSVKIERRFDALIMQISTYLNLSVPIVIISIFCTLKDVSVYSIYNLVFAGLIGIMSIFSAGVSAAFGNIIAKKQDEILKTNNNQFEFLIYMILTFLYSCAIILIIPFVTVYTKGVTDINYINPMYGILFVIWGVFYNARIPHTSLIDGAGLFREARKANILQLVLLIGLSVILVQFIGVIGVLISLIIASIYRIIDLILMVKKSVIKASPVPAFLRIVRIFSVILFSYIPFIFWINISAKSLFEWFLWAIVISIWCAITTLISNFIFDKKTFLDTVRRFMKMKKK